jgi:uncharacterized protein YciI
MYIIDLTYKVPVETIDLHLENHVEYVKKQYTEGNFIASGRKIPRTGGIIFSKVTSRSELKKIISQDPFKQHDLAKYEIIEFAPSRTCPQLTYLME